jgi:hypothetical protein
METNHQTSKEYFKLTSIIHLYLVLGIILFGLVDYFFIIDFHQVDMQSGLAKLLVYLVPGLVVVGIVASNVIFVIRMNVLKESTDLKLKMMGYRLSLIVRYMLLEGSALFALVAVFMTNNINYIVYAVLLVILLVLKRPTRKSAITDMQLNQQEIAMLEDPESIIM